MIYKKIRLHFPQLFLFTFLFFETLYHFETFKLNVFLSQVSP